MADADDKQFAIETIEKGAALLKDIDALVTDTWMKLPEHIRQRLNETGAGSEFDALAKANRLLAVAEEARKLRGSEA